MNPAATSRRLRRLFGQYLLVSGVLANLALLVAAGLVLHKLGTVGMGPTALVLEVAERLDSRAPAVAHRLRALFTPVERAWVFESPELEDLRARYGRIGREGPPSAGAAPLAAPGTEAVHVADSKALQQALRNAGPGSVIVIEPGTYAITTRTIRLGAAGRADAPVVVTAAVPGRTVLELDTLEGFFVDVPYWTFQDLIIRGVCANDSRCEHAFHIVGDGHHATIRRVTTLDFNAHYKINGVQTRTSATFPDAGVLEDNHLSNTDMRHTANPVSLIDAVGVRDWVVRRNVIANFIKQTGDRTSYGAFFKGNGSGNAFVNNLVICRYDMTRVHGAQIGLSFGNGGSGQAACRERDCGIEHTGGVMKGNVIANCEDVGIYLMKSAATQLTNNTLLNTFGIDVRFPESQALIANNVLSGRISDRNGGASEAIANLVFSARDLRDYFSDPGADATTAQARADIVDRGVDLQEAETDFCGSPRGPERVDLGAIEYDYKPESCTLPLAIKRE